MAAYDEKTAQALRQWVTTAPMISDRFKQEFVRAYDIKLLLDDPSEAVQLDPMILNNFQSAYESMRALSDPQAPVGAGVSRLINNLSKESYPWAMGSNAHGMILEYLQDLYDSTCDLATEWWVARYLAKSKNLEAQQKTVQESKAMASPQTLPSRVYTPSLVYSQPVPQAYTSGNVSAPAAFGRAASMLGMSGQRTFGGAQSAPQFAPVAPRSPRALVSPR